MHGCLPACAGCECCTAPSLWHEALLRQIAAFADLLVRRLNKVPGMRDICSHIVMKTLKDSRHQLPL